MECLSWRMVLLKTYRVGMQIGIWHLAGLYVNVIFATSAVIGYSCTQTMMYSQCSCLTGSEHVPVYWSLKLENSERFPICSKNGNPNERAEGQVSADWRWSEDANDQAFSSRFDFCNLVNPNQTLSVMDSQHGNQLEITVHWPMLTRLKTHGGRQSSLHWNWPLAGRNAYYKKSSIFLELGGVSGYMYRQFNI